MYNRLLLVCLWVFNSIQAQTLVSITSKTEKIPLQGQVSFLVDSVESLTINDILLRGQSLKWKSNQVASYPNFNDNPYPHWLRFKIINRDRPVTINLVTKGVDSLQAFIVSQRRVVHTFPLNGSHVPIYQRQYISPYVILPFVLEKDKEYMFFLRIRNVNYRLAASPLVIYTRDNALRYIQSRVFFHSIYIGGMFIILMFSLLLIVLFRERLYLYYACCVASSLVIMLCYNDYYYLIFDSAPAFIRSKNIFGVLSAIVPVVYLLFAEDFLRISWIYDNKIIKISRIIIVIQGLLLVVIVWMGQPLFVFRWIFYLTMSALSCISLLYVYRSIRRQYLPGWLFLFATVPVLLTVILETFSDWHSLPVQEVHNFFYYTTLFEMFMLTCGIVYRLKLDQDQKKALQRDVMQAQITAQEAIKEQIGADLHDVIGGQLGALRAHLEVLHREVNADKYSDNWKMIYRILQLSIENIRNLSFRMTSQRFSDLGLVGMLKETYAQLESPRFYFHLEGMEHRLDLFIEMVLHAVVTEAINNIFKHANASEVSIQLIKDRQHITLLIEDNGVGFNAANTNKKSQGLKNIGIRVRDYLNGEFILDTQQGRGTILIIKVNQLEIPM